MPNELHTAAAKKNNFAEVRKLLEELNIDPNTPHSFYHTTPAEFAAQSGDSGNLEILIIAGASLKTTVGRGNLMDWSLQNNKEMQDYLANADSNLWEKFEDETTTLHAAALAGDKSRVEAILAADPELLNKRNQLGRPALFYAIAAGNAGVTDILMKKMTLPEKISEDVSIDAALNKAAFHLALAIYFSNQKEKALHHYTQAIEWYKYVIQKLEPAFNTTTINAEDKKNFLAAAFGATYCESQMAGIFRENLQKQTDAASSFENSKKRFLHAKRASFYFQKIIKGPNAITDSKEFRLVFARYINASHAWAESLREHAVKQRAEKKWTEASSCLTTAIKNEKTALNLIKIIAGNKSNTKAIAISKRLAELYEALIETCDHELRSQPNSAELYLKKFNYLSEYIEFVKNNSEALNTSDKKIISMQIDLNQIQETLANLTLSQFSKDKSSKEALACYKKAIHHFEMAMQLLARLPVQEKQKKLDEYNHQIAKLNDACADCYYHLGEEEFEIANWDNAQENFNQSLVCNRNAAALVSNTSEFGKKLTAKQSDIQVWAYKVLVQTLQQNLHQKDKQIDALTDELDQKIAATSAQQQEASAVQMEESLVRVGTQIDVLAHALDAEEESSVSASSTSKEGLKKLSVFPAAATVQHQQVSDAEDWDLLEGEFPKSSSIQKGLA